MNKTEQTNSEHEFVVRKITSLFHSQVGQVDGGCGVLFVCLYIETVICTALIILT